MLWVGRDPKVQLISPPTTGRETFHNTRLLWAPPAWPGTPPIMERYPSLDQLFMIIPYRHWKCRFSPIYFPPSKGFPYLNLARCVNCSCLWRGHWFWGWRWGHRLMWLGVASSQGPSQWFSANRSLSRERSACNPAKRGKSPKTQDQTGSPVSNINKSGFTRLWSYILCLHPPYGIPLPSMFLIIASTLLIINPKSLELSHRSSNYQLDKRWFTTWPYVGIHQLKVPNRRRRPDWVPLLSTFTCVSSLPVFYALIFFSLKFGLNGSASTKVTKGHQQGRFQQFQHWSLRIWPFLHQHKASSKGRKKILQITSD